MLVFFFHWTKLSSCHDQNTQLEYKSHGHQHLPVNLCLFCEVAGFIIYIDKFYVFIFVCLCVCKEFKTVKIYYRACKNSI
jgi:hypothetical protein